MTKSNKHIINKANKMAPKEGVPPCTSCCATDWKANDYDKTKFVGTWVVEKDFCGSKGDPMCCGKVCMPNRMYRLCRPGMQHKERRATEAVDHLTSP